MSSSDDHGSGSVFHPDVMRTAMYALWGALTLILLFTVVFLMVRMSEQQEQLAALGAGPEGSGVESQGSASTRDVRLYFARAERVVLQAESRLIPFTGSTVQNCRFALEALIEGPQEVLSPVLPPTTQIRGMYLLGNGELVVDFSRDLESTQVKSASAELLMVHAITTSLTQASLQGEDNRTVRSIRFLLEGSPVQETFPVHIDLSGPVTPDQSIVEHGAVDAESV